MSGICGINQKIEINQIEYFLLHQQDKMEYKTIAAAYWTPNTIFKVPVEWDIGDVKVVKDILYYKGEIKDVPKRVSLGDDNTTPVEMFDHTGDLNSDDELEE